MTLLLKTRKLNAMLQESGGDAVNFKEMAEKLSSVIECNAFIVSRKGKLLGLEIHQTIENDRMKKMFDEKLQALERKAKKSKQSKIERNSINQSRKTKKESKIKIVQSSTKSPESSAASSSKTVNSNKKANQHEGKNDLKTKKN